MNEGLETSTIPKNPIIKLAIFVGVKGSFSINLAKNRVKRGPTNSITLTSLNSMLTIAQNCEVTAAAPKNPRNTSNFRCSTGPKKSAFFILQRINIKISCPKLLIKIISTLGNAVAAFFRNTAEVDKVNDDKSTINIP
eukprot:NODE_116_length_19003_cov_0.233707.p13 type:complete len:138 gc:universal NODE_116_length_19003_cov_0.233707:1011-1424(+)